MPGTDSGIIQFGARYYEPGDATWTQLDPSGQTAGYSYAGDDPINLSDQSGLCFVVPCSVEHAIGDGASALAGAFASGATDAYNFVSKNKGTIGCIAVVGGLTAFTGGGALEALEFKAVLKEGLATAGKKFLGSTGGRLATGGGVVAAVGQDIGGCPFS